MNIKRVLLLGLLSSGFAAAAPVELPKTGQTTCYAEDGTVINCAGTGQDGEIQAGAEWPSPRFTNNSDGTITDNLTGLMWLQDGKYLWRFINPPEWEHALSLVDTFNTTSAYTDWRVPNAIELESLSNAGQSNVATWLAQPEQGFSNMFGFWTSTSFATDYEFFLGQAWEMGFNAAGVYDNLAWGRSKKGTNGSAPVIAVRTARQGNATWRTGQTLCYNSLNRNDDPTPVYADTIIDCADTGQDGETQAGVAWPSPRFTDEGDGTVTDNLTGLVWLKDANCIKTEYPGFDTERWEVAHPEGDGRVGWQRALDFVNGINDGTYANCGAGFTDWHLPNRREALSVIDFSTVYSSVTPVSGLPAGHPFINLVEGNQYWTSTTHTGFPTRAIALDLAVGAIAWYEKDGNNINDIPADLSGVWPVRAPASTPEPNISVSPLNHDFGLTVVNGFSGPLEVTISNNGTADLSVASMATDASAFILNNSAGLMPCGTSTPTIPAGGNCTVTVTFSPDAVGVLNGKLTIISNSQEVGATTEVTLTGEGVMAPVANISVTPTSHVFADVVINQSSPVLEVTLSNSGNQGLNVSNIALTVGINYQLNINAGSNPCATTSPAIGAGGNCTVGVTFTPGTVANNLTDTLTVTSDDPDEPSVGILLSGNGVADNPGPSEDNVPPIVTSVTPLRDASNVPANIAAITATFNEPVQGINGATIVVSSAGSAVAGTVSYDVAGMTVWFTPSASLAYMTTYTVTIASAQVRDVAGNNMAQDDSWEFTTGGDPALAGCEPELQQEAGCVNFDYFTYGTGIDLNTFGSSTTGYSDEEGARQSVSFEVSPSTDSVETSSSLSEATARVDDTAFSLNSHSRRATESSDLAGAWSMGASKIEVTGVPPGTVIPMSLVVQGDFDGPGGTLLLQVKDFDDYRGLGSVSVRGSGIPATSGPLAGLPTNTYTQMVDPYGDKTSAANYVRTANSGSSNIRLDFLYPAVPNNGIYVWFVAGVSNYEGVSNDDTDYTATLEVEPPPGVTVTLASGQAFSGDPDTDGDGVDDLQEGAQANDAAIASPASIDGTANILVDASANVGVTLSQVWVRPEDDLSLNQAGKPTDRQFPDGLVSFRLNGLAPGATAKVRLTFPTAFPADRSYYKVDDSGFYPFTTVDFLDNHTVELTVTDGGAGDRDGVANGVIVDPGGVSVPIAAPVVTVSRGAIGSAIFGSGDGEHPVFGFVINSDSADTEIHSLTIQSTGTVSTPADFGTVSVYRDENLNGIPEVAEQIASGSYAAGDTQLTFTLTQPYQLPAGDSYFLVTYQF